MIVYSVNRHYDGIYLFADEDQAKSYAAYFKDSEFDTEYVIGSDTAEEMIAELEDD